MRRNHRNVPYPMGERNDDSEEACRLWRYPKEYRIAHPFEATPGNSDIQSHPSISMQQCQDMWLSRQGTCSRTFYTTCDFFRRHATKNMGSVDLKMGCKIWTPFWGPPNCFFLSRPQNGVQILGPILRSTLPVVFSQRDAEKGHPRVGCL